MILKDMVIIDKYLFVEIGAFVIIKRDGKYYEIVVRMRHDYKSSGHEVQKLVEYKKLIERFMRECHRTNTHYKITKGKILEDAFGQIYEKEVKF